MKKSILFTAVFILLLFPLQGFSVPYYNWDFNLDGYSSHTYDFADVVDLNSTKLGFLDTYSWTHALPGDFNGSQNSVTDAKLWISASGVMFDYSTVAHIQGMGQWVFLDGQDWHLTWNWNIVFDEPTSETVINLPSNMENYAFWEQNPINVCVGTGQFFSSVTLEQSVLMMDYNNTPPSSYASTVPEPATILLFGLGLLGMGYMRRRQK